MSAIAVTIAGSDSSGGAGIQADLKTFSALGVYGASVITALTAQNTTGVSAIHEAPADFVRAEMDAVYGDLAVKATKIGMLSSVTIIKTVCEGLGAHQTGPVVLDPVMVAATGAALISDDAVATLLDVLIPKARLITPNLLEAARLLDEAVAEDEAAMERQAHALIGKGAQAVLIKGGHGTGPFSRDILVDGAAVYRFEAPRIDTQNTHGTGCTLSSAIAAGLARGMELAPAVEAAKAYVHAAIVASDRLDIGRGHGPVHHFHALWKETA
ncbi:MAG: bifunctional hydroxymethylpyrimidine kinase/phosphomethylpyrimidine kinase [Hyphomicrobiaceae bacterium]|nr:bifunctional hydroxymethylpyrimidine kinase/phosphomethylpyrimidine kinase [Hyphomicrobiaceae bacterium]